MSKNDPTLTPRPYKIGSAWYVLIEWVDGRSESPGDFASEQEAQRWIETDSERWLAARA